MGIEALAPVIGALVAAALASYRLLHGPGAANRIVALDILLAAAIALCIGVALHTKRTEFLDVAIALSVCAFVGTIGWARLIEETPPSEGPPAQPAADAAPGAQPGVEPPR